MKADFANFDPTKLKNKDVGSMADELEATAMFGAVDEMYKDFEAKATAIETRMKAASEKLDYVELDNLRKEMEDLTGLKKGVQGNSAMKELGDTIKTKFKDVDP